MLRFELNSFLITLILILCSGMRLFGSDFTDNSFLVAKVGAEAMENRELWEFIEANEWVAISMQIDSLNGNAVLANSKYDLSKVLGRLATIMETHESKIIPVFIRYSGDIGFLDSVINQSPLSSRIFFLPQGETWPTINYLVQSNRRVVFFVDGNFRNESRIMHPLQNYALQISATQIMPNSVILSSGSNINKELFLIHDFQNLPTVEISSRMGKNMIPDYVNYLLQSWTKYGKKPNFIEVGEDILSFNFLINQINSFSAMKGRVRTTGRNLDRVYWKNPGILITGGRFSFPIRGGEEMILSPFVPGYKMTPEQLIVTTEMALPDEYSVLASPMNLSENLTAGFHFDGSLQNIMNPDEKYSGSNFSFTEDIDRGQVLKLPENSFILLGDPNLYGLPNSSFTVSCFVKFTDILEFGDNAILGNDEEGYRRGMHLILRSGHPYFGLWANDFMSEEVLQNNTWYHLTWRYIIETGQQAIFLNGKNVGGSDGHPPYSGSSDLHIGSAFSQGASLRGYIDNFYIWDRPLGNDEINRLSLDETVIPDQNNTSRKGFNTLTLYVVVALVLLLLLLFTVWVIVKSSRKRKQKPNLARSLSPSKNQIRFFGEFRAVADNGEDVTALFTPKVKELFIFAMIGAQKNKLGAPIAELDATLWEGVDSNKLANNRAVTLNKLRKILVRFDNISINSANGFLQLHTNGTFFCDYTEAYRLCRKPEGMTRQELEHFFHLVQEGRLLKGTDWPWLDEIRGFIGNQVMDNLLKLAALYQKENKVTEVEKIALRIIDYDDLSEEAVYLQIWAQQKAGNTNLARFHFNSFLSRYEKAIGEKFKMNFEEFIRAYSGNL